MVAAVKVTVIADKCIGSGSCEMLAPEVFEVRDDGLAHVLADDPAPELASQVAQAAEACPTRAIRII